MRGVDQYGEAHSEASFLECAGLQVTYIVFA